MNQQDWMEIQGDIAEKMTEIACKADRIKCWKVDADGSERFTEKAQDMFNYDYERIDNVMIFVLGVPSENFTRGFGKKKVSAAKRRQLTRQLSDYAGFDVSKIVGNLT